MTNSNSQPTLVISSTCLTQDGSTTMADASLHRSIVGSWQYILITIPDLAYNVNKVCQFKHQQEEHHCKEVKHILCYVVGTLHHNILLRKYSHLHLQVFVDVDWGSYPKDRKLTDGYMVSLGQNPIS